MADKKPFRLLFVCLGNICRSPAAEGIMKKFVEDSGRSADFFIDSAGTADWHEGKFPDARMTRQGSKRGYNFDSIARQVRSEDFSNFDLILVMDQNNLREIRHFNPDGNLMHKVMLFTDFAINRSETQVPDPYYGGDDGFEQVLDILEDGCRELLVRL
ncbi:MAG: low molecular weight phosphotyrosine protein phosphatase [Verrucomicrobiaceae bacterium]|nr:low molecular weight phosphotyrosine protein phosphatase [Verrucomicrobiaceae bacterium]